MAFCLHGAAYDDDDMYVMINAGQEDITFGVHEGTVGSCCWAIDTALASPQDLLGPGEESAAIVGLLPRAGPLGGRAVGRQIAAPIGR